MVRANRPRLFHQLVGYSALVTDDSEHGAVPVEDAAVADPPAVDEVLERQRIDHHAQASASVPGAAPTDEELATEAAGGAVVGRDPAGGVDIEGPNSS